MKKIELLEKENIRLDLPNFNAGDTVKVHVKIKEGEKERIQAFQGVVISKRRGSSHATFTVRKVSYGIGVERIFPMHSPIIDKIEILTRGRVRRAKIYYLRKLRGKAARIKEKFFIDHGTGTVIGSWQNTWWRHHQGMHNNCFGQDDYTPGFLQKIHFKIKEGIYPDQVKRFPVVLY